MSIKKGTTASRRKDAIRLQKIREALKMSQREFAQELMVTHGAIGLWEREERSIPGPVLKLMLLYEEKLKLSRNGNPGV